MAHPTLALKHGWQARSFAKLCNLGKFLPKPIRASGLPRKSPVLRLSSFALYRSLAFAKCLQHWGVTFSAKMVRYSPRHSFLALLICLVCVLSYPAPLCAVGGITNLAVEVGVPLDAGVLLGFHSLFVEGVEVDEHVSIIFHTCCTQHVFCSGGLSAAENWCFEGSRSVIFADAEVKFYPKRDIGRVTKSNIFGNPLEIGGLIILEHSQMCRVYSPIRFLCQGMVINNIV